MFAAPLVVLPLSFLMLDAAIAVSANVAAESTPPRMKLPGAGIPDWIPLTRASMLPIMPVIQVWAMRSSFCFSLLPSSASIAADSIPLIALVIDLTPL